MATSMTSVRRHQLVAIYVATDSRLLTEAVWPLIGLSTWFLEFSEKLLRECVLLHNAGEDGVPAQPSMSVDEDDLFGSSTCGHKFSQMPKT